MISQVKLHILSTCVQYQHTSRQNTSLIPGVVFVFLVTPDNKQRFILLLQLCWIPFTGICTTQSISFLHIVLSMLLYHAWTHVFATGPASWGNWSVLFLFFIFFWEDKESLPGKKIKIIPVLASNWQFKWDTYLYLFKEGKNWRLHKDGPIALRICCLRQSPHST